MLRNLSALEGFPIRSLDGEIGLAVDTYFDDYTWTVRYLVVDTGKWLPGRKVLVSPFAVRAIVWQPRHIDVGLTREHVKGSPEVDTEKPVSRQHESAYFDYFGYPYYWGGSYRWGPAPFPYEFAADYRSTVTDGDDQQHDSDAHLRSTKAVIGYHLEAAGGSIGHVEDFIFDEKDWSLRFLIVDTRNWLPGRHVLIPVHRVSGVSWDDRVVRVDMRRNAIRGAPEWQPDLMPAPGYEAYLRRRAEKPRPGHDA